MKYMVNALLASLLVCLLLAVGLSANAAAPGKTRLDLTIHSIRSDRGAVYVSVFNKEDGFPDDAAAAIRKKKIRAKAGELTTSFQNLPAGDYAIAFIHDEDGNGKLDTNALGIPKEGFGFSNDPKISFGAPSFESSRFTVFGPQTKERARMKYF